MDKMYNKVSPRNGVDFSKLRKYRPGGQIPKFQTPATELRSLFEDFYKNNLSLKNWDESLDYSKAGPDIVGGGDVHSSQHTKAGNIDAAYAGNEAYIGNKDRIGSDINYWISEYRKKNPTASIQQAVDAYNQMAEYIRTYQQQSHDYERDRNDAVGTFNDNYSNMFRSRSFNPSGAVVKNDSAYIGFDPDSKTTYGSSTFLRRMDMYEKDWNALTPEEKLARTHNVSWDPSGTTNYQVYKKANGDIALLPDPNDPPVDEPPVKEPPVQNPPEQTPPGQDGPFEPVDYTGTDGYKYKIRPFTQPIVNGMIAAANSANAINQYNLDMQKKAFLPEDPHHDYKVTNAYANRSANLRAANEMKQALTGRLGSDLTTNLNALANVDNQILQTQLKNNELGAQEFNTTTQQAQAVANGNIDYGVKGFNTRGSILAQEEDYKINARKQLRDKLTAIRTNNYDANNVAHQQWLQGEQLEMDSAQDRENQLHYNQDLRKAYQDYNTLRKGIGYDSSVLSQLTADWSAAGRKGELPADFDIEGYNLARKDPDKYRQFQINWLKMNANTEAGRKYYDLWQSNLDEAANKGYDLQLDAKDQLDRTYLGRLNTYSGQGFLGFSQRNFIGKYVPLTKQGGILSAKQGARFIDYLEHNRKIQEDSLKRYQKATQQTIDVLKRDLDAIDDESLFLLKNIFK